MTGEPLGQDHVYGQEGHLLFGRFEDGQEAISNFVLGGMEGLEVPSHGSRANNIKG